MRSCLARDAFSLLHFPMVLGVIALAAGIEAAIAHPAEGLHTPHRIALAAAMVLFPGGTHLAIWRATGRLLVPRAAITVATAVALIVVPGVAPWVSLAIAFAGVAAIATVEQRVWPAGAH